MFQKVLKMFHDGIVIIEDGNVIYENEKVHKIFKIQPQEVCVQQAPEQDNEIENTSISSLQMAMMNCIPKVDIELSNTEESFADGRFEFKSLWDFLQFEYKSYQPSLHKQKDFINPFDGTYFKYKKEENGESQRIQIFSQMIHIGNHKMLMATVRDMSLWLQLEQQKNISQMKTVAFAQAAHEFRNPLNGIIQSLDLLSNIIDTSNKYYQITKNCSHLMLFLVNDILDFAQIESQTIILNQDQVDIREMLQQCSEIFNFQAEAKGLQILREVDPIFPKFIYSDQNRIKQIIINLMSNAVKYTQKGYIKLRAVPIDQRHFMIQVIDTGVGINKKEFNSLFSAFKKIKDHRELNKQGCGLGLTLSKNLAKALGGDISLDSVKDVGSTFTLFLKQNGSEQVNSSQSLKSLSQSNQTLKLDQTNSYSKSSSMNILFPDDGLLNLNEKYGTRQVVGPFFRKEHQGINNLISSNDISFGIDEEQCSCKLVLIADDEPFNVIALESQLYLLGIQVDKVYDGKAVMDQVIDRLDNQCPCGTFYKLLIIDNQMPIKSGFEIATDIRKLQQEGEIPMDVKLVLCSADSSFVAPNYSFNHQEYKLFDYILDKPVDKKRLVTMLQTFDIIQNQ